MHFMCPLPYLAHKGDKLYFSQAGKMHFPFTKSTVHSSKMMAVQESQLMTTDNLSPGMLALQAQSELPTFTHW